MTDRLAVVFLGRAPMPPDQFVRTAYRLLGRDADASHSGKASASFAYRVADGAVLVAWGDLLPACSRPGLPVRFVSVPEVVPDRMGKVKVRIRHLTPTLLKRQGGPRVAWFDPEAYVRALAGVLGIAGLELAPVEAARDVEFARVSTEAAVWNLGRGRERGFVGEVVAVVPSGWIPALRLARWTGIGCKRGWEGRAGGPATGGWSGECLFRGCFSDHRLLRRFVRTREPGRDCLLRLGGLPRC